MSRYYAYIVAYISRLEIGNVVLRPARLHVEVGHYDSVIMPIYYAPSDGLGRGCTAKGDKSSNGRRIQTPKGVVRRKGEERLR